MIDFHAIRIHTIVDKKETFLVGIAIMVIGSENALIFENSNQLCEDVSDVETYLLV